MPFSKTRNCLLINGNIYLKIYIIVYKLFVLKIDITIPIKSSYGFKQIS